MASASASTSAAAPTADSESDEDPPAAGAGPFLETVDQEDTETVEILRRMAEKKPYHAVMRILLYVWPRRRREQATKELQELKKTVKPAGGGSAAQAIVLELSNYTNLLWHNLNVEVYYGYINRHKHYVAKSFEYFNDTVVASVKRRLFLEGLLLAEYLPDQDTTRSQIDAHDESKYSFVETVTYAMRWYPCHGLGDYDDEAWTTGLQHHFCHNEHHPEYWGARPMHWRYIVEAMYDMAAMELERQFKGQAPENRAKLLVFDKQYLTRFEATNQLEFLQRLAQYTMEAYCAQTGHAVPQLPDKSQFNAMNPL